ncbi:MAG TPA: DUF1134 domain-containing protein [Methylocystis sp.]|nr:DUF1134 domain-containing protein [Methylocystis sp.]
MLDSDDLNPKSSALSRRALLRFAAGSCLALPAGEAFADYERPEPYSNNEVIESGHRFFGSIARSLGDLVETAASHWGRPNAYILGQEGSGAFVGGLRYGEGEMFTRNMGRHKVYWQGPSLGFDAGADGDRTMMLVYHLPAVEAIYQRFGGMDGSAYLVGGLGMTALNAGETVLAPIRTGLGARLGVNMGYLKFTDRPTWNPF